MLLSSVAVLGTKAILSVSLTAPSVLLQNRVPSTPAPAGTVYRVVVMPAAGTICEKMLSFVDIDYNVVLTLLFRCQTQPMAAYYGIEP